MSNIFAENTTSSSIMKKVHSEKFNFRQRIFKYNHKFVVSSGAVKRIQNLILIKFTTKVSSAILKVLETKLNEHWPCLCESWNFITRKLSELLFIPSYLFMIHVFTTYSFFTSAAVLIIYLHFIINFEDATTANI